MQAMSSENKLWICENTIGYTFNQHNNPFEIINADIVGVLFPSGNKYIISSVMNNFFKVLLSIYTSIRYVSRNNYYRIVFKVITVFLLPNSLIMD